MITMNNVWYLPIIALAIIIFIIFYMVQVVKDLNGEEKDNGHGRSR